MKSIVPLLLDSKVRCVIVVVCRLLLLLLFVGCCCCCHCCCCCCCCCCRHRSLLLSLSWCSLLLSLLLLLLLFLPLLLLLLLLSYKSLIVKFLSWWILSVSIILLSLYSSLGCFFPFLCCFLSSSLPLFIHFITFLAALMTKLESSYSISSSKMVRTKCSSTPPKKEKKLFDFCCFQNS